MLTSDIVEVVGPRPDLSFRMRLLSRENADVVKNILALLPLEGFLLHVVVAGETIYMPAPSVALDSRNMVERRKGTVYYNTTSQSICFCYGAVTESTPVNQFAQVLEEDLEHLEKLGRVVYEQTVSRQIPTIVRVTLRRHSGDDNPPPPEPKQPAKDFDGHWLTAKELIDEEITQLRRPVEPDEIRTIRLGATRSRAGSEGSVLQTIVFLQGFLSTLGPHVFSRLLAVSQDEDMTLPLMVRQTREFLIRTFNHFVFLVDLGLERMAGVGRMYDEALSSLRTLEEYRLLTDSVRTLVQLLYRWLHLIFPWYLKDQFASHTPDEVAGVPKLSLYGEQTETD